MATTTTHLERAERAQDKRKGCREAEGLIQGDGKQVLADSLRW
jgi:hypothetical protein